ncbi:type II toxin-antitoxin system YhaV family toxin [Stenotrophomonas sp. PS02289]|uniref:type II toxin-antitoxin system YhaV family toxin n=1 Tax=Stenotrophomonas sp. PS02289 TaxID=2991422 RepID=UPI00249CB98B|nr:type II toxin-antitoxin system YhaV family toxin [Stenotrophomonas sp. PS02289]
MVIHGWTVYAHACFAEQLTGLIEAVADAARRRPDDFRRTNAFKRLSAVTALAFDQIPSHPADPRYRQGATLGTNHQHWFRAKFFQQYRLFFRFNDREKVIILAWVNDEKTLRAYGSKTDAYATFQRMLANGRPPDDWNALKAAVVDDTELKRLMTLSQKT